MYKKYIMNNVLGYIILLCLIVLVILMNRKATIFDYYSISKQDKEELTVLSKSQLQQDIFVLLELKKKRNGYFVEFGATDGVSLSNSYMLENNFGWSGILAEPAVSWHESLYRNRPLAKIDTKCVWKENDVQITFKETDLPVLSTIAEYESIVDANTNYRVLGKKYTVSTITLLSLLEKYNAPDVIDYLSIDTEGSEFDILEAFFQSNTRYRIKIITCEHNYTENREKVYDLLTKNGYERKYQDISYFDDFYILKDR